MILPRRAALPVFKARLIGTVHLDQGVPEKPFFI